MRKALLSLLFFTVLILCVPVSASQNAHALSGYGLNEGHALNKKLHVPAPFSIAKAVNLADLSEQGQEQRQCIMKTDAHSRNFNAVISKTESAKVLENIKIQRTRSAEISIKKDKNNHSLFQAVENCTAVSSNSRQTEIHQNLSQRK